MERPEFEDREIMLDMLEELRGRTTIIMVTNHGPYLKKSDKVLWMEKGRVRMFGKAEDVLPDLPEEYQC